ncbi:MAG: NADH-quinone oxidoreductase subunit J [Reichenbachiella sp.]
MNILAFYGLAGLSVFAALMILFSKNIVHAVFMLVLVFLGIAGVFMVSNAEFVGVTQILVYIGGILILMMFGVMLTNRLDGQKLLTQNRRVIPAMLLGSGLIMVFYGMLKERFPVFIASKAETSLSVTERIGVNLMTDQLVALELTAVLLLAVLIGSSLIAGLHFKTKNK